MHSTMGKPSLSFAGLICISAILLTKGDNVTTEVEITDHPQNDSVFIGMPAILTCRFSSVVNCHWTHNGNTVHHNSWDEEKIMLLNSDGRNATDCSIIITSIQASDHGTWNCIGSANETNQTISSKEAWISTQQFIKVAETIHNVTAEEDMPVILPCKFNRPVTCLWGFGPATSSLAYQLGSRHSYTKYRLTKDCSLNISKALLFHNGAYECTGSLINDHFKHTSTIWLTVLQTKPSEEGISEQPTNTSAFLWSTAVLHCTFLFDVTCVWEQIYSPDVGSSRVIVEPNNQIKTKTCTLTIKTFSQVDAGRYRCIGQDVNQTTWYSTDAWLTVKDAQELMVVQDPESVNVTLGSQNVVLTCIFSDLVDCDWELNGVRLYIPRYPFSYAHPNYDGEDTRDCSLEISYFAIEQSGNYVCKSKPSHSNQTQSKVAWVVAPNYIIHIVKQPPAAAKFKLGHQVTLECTFNTTTNCQWTRNGIPFYPNFYHAKYDYNNSNGLNTTDCTMHIKTFNVTDVGTYKCASAQGHLRTATSRDSKITAGDINIGVTDNPKNVTVNRGEDVILDCGFNISVYCIWEQLNGTAILSTDNSPHYQFLQRRNPRMNCSMRISSALLLDAGLWICKGEFNDETQMSTSAAHLTVKDIQVDRNKTKTKLALLYSHYGFTGRDTVQLKCEFNMPPAICYWTYRANSLSKDFKLLKLVIGLADCSADLNQSTSSSGRYQCQAISSDTNEILSATELIVDYIPSSYEGNQLTEGPKNTTVQYGQTVTLACKFLEPMICIWIIGGELRNSQTVRSERYRLPHQSAAHTDCSLTIISVQKSDIGHWKCQGARSTTPGIFTPAIITPTSIIGDAWITEQKMPQDPEMISEMGIVANTTINGSDLKEHFHCISKHGNPPANLTWSLNGALVNGKQEIRRIDEFLYTTKLFWNPEIRVKTNDTLLCIADHIEYDSVKFAKVIIVIPKTELDKQSAILSIPTIIVKNGTLSSDHWVNHSVPMDNLPALLCHVEARDTKQALFWEYAGKRYSGIREDRPTENGTVEIWLQWNDTIPVRDNLTSLTCITELIITPQRASIQIQNSASVVPPGATNMLAVTLSCIIIALVLIAVIGYTIYRFKTRKVLNAPVLLDENSLTSRGSEDL